MGDLTIKPADEGHLKLQNDAGNTLIEMRDDDKNFLYVGDHANTVYPKVNELGGFMQNATHKALVLGY